MHFQYSSLATTFLQSRNDKYYDRIRITIKVGLILARLTHNIIGSVFKSAQRAFANRLVDEPTLESSSKFGPRFQAREGTKMGVAEISRMDLDAKTVQGTHIAVCRGEMLIGSHRDAEVLGDLLHRHLKRNEDDQDCLTLKVWSD